MSDIAIRAEKLGKLYRIGRRERYITLRDLIVRSFSVPFRWFNHNHQSSIPDTKSHPFIWALKDFSFEVKQGEVIGIIGRNGAGKSTLLKILARITEPTEGYAEVHGRVGSLLEVGTGFHPELTGRENIYLSGAVLGMKKREIDCKFDEIVAFSEMEQFIDTPVKYYSSGMYVRLAFAVAAHLDPEILLIDEVLAVGDAAFQKKCLGKMGDVAKEGRTVLFVSHNMAMVRKLCERAILLENGRIKASGEVNEIVTKYESEVLSPLNDNETFSPISNNLYGLSLESVKAETIQQTDGRTNLRVEVRLRSLKRVSRVGIGVWIYTYDGILVAKLGSRFTNAIIEELKGECCCVLECQNVHQFLASGKYLISLIVNLQRMERAIVAEHVASFQVPAYDHFGSGRYFILHQHGLVPLPLKLKEITHR